MDETRIKYVYELIAGVIDFEDDADAVGDQQAMVQRGVSDELDEMKHLYQGALAAYACAAALGSGR